MSKEGSRPGTSVDALSHDLLARALAAVTDPRDRKSCRLASRALSLAESASRRSARPLSRAALPRVLRLFPALAALDLSACAGLDDAALAASLSRSPPSSVALRRVCLARATGVGWRGLEAVVAACPRLEAVDLSHCLAVGDREVAALAAAAGLTELVLDKCLCVTDVGLAKVAVGCPGLERLSVRWCREISDIGVDLLAKKCPHLRSVDISYLKEMETCFLSKLSTIKETLTVLRLDGLEVFSSTLQAIGDSCKNLVEIGLSKCASITDSGIVAFVNQCKFLRTIDITCCHLLTDDALGSIAENCRRLECIRLESCPLVSDKGLERIGNLCSHLKEIDLTDCCINDAALQHLSRCSELLTLKLGLCSSISDKGLGYISSNCAKLMELDIYRCRAITDDGLAALAGGCKKIRMLNLRYCDKITDAGLKHLSTLEELTNLEMRCLVRVTGIGIASIAMGCPNLVELDLKRCYSVDDTSIWAVARYSQNLRQLDISYSQVTGLGLCHLLSSLRCLQDLKMVHLSWVSIEGFEMALRAACGRLSGMQSVLSPELLQMLQACGCRVRWANKPHIYK